MSSSSQVSKSDLLERSKQDDFFNSFFDKISLTKKIAVGVGVTTLFYLYRTRAVRKDLLAAAFVALSGSVMNFVKSSNENEEVDKVK